MDSVKAFVRRLRIFRLVLVRVMIPMVTSFCLFCWLTYFILGQIPFQWFWFMGMMMANSLTGVGLIFFVGVSAFSRKFWSEITGHVRSLTQSSTAGAGKGGSAGNNNNNNNARRNSSSVAPIDAPSAPPPAAGRQAKRSDRNRAHNNTASAHENSNQPRRGTLHPLYKDEYVRSGYEYFLQRSRRMSPRVRHFNEDPMELWDGSSKPWRRIIDDAFQEVEDFCAGRRGDFVVKSREQGLVFEVASRSHRIEGIELNRISGDLKVTPSELVAVMYSLPEVGSFDQSLIYGRVLHHFPDARTILTHSANRVSIFPHRDFISLVSYRRKEPEANGAGETWVMVTVDVPKAYSACEGAVRGAVVRFGYVIRALDATTAHVTMVNQSLIRGMLPPFLINATLHKVLIHYMRGYEARVRRAREGNYIAELVKMLGNDEHSAAYVFDDPTEETVPTTAATADTSRMSEYRGERATEMKRVLESSDREKFTDFIRQKFAGEVLELYDSCGAYSSAAGTEERARLGEAIVATHLAEGAPKAVDMLDALRRAVLTVRDTGDWKPETFDATRAMAFELLMANFYNQYVKANER